MPDEQAVNPAPIVATSGDVLKKFDGAEGMAKARQYDEPAKTGYEEEVAAALAKTFGEELDEDGDLKAKGAEPATPAAPKEEKPASDTKPTSPAQAAEKDEPAKEPESTGTSSTPATTSTLDPLLARSLKRKGYTDDEIAAEYKEDPKSFERLAKYIHREAQAEDARAFQAAQQQQRQAPPPTAPQITAPPPAVQPGQPSFDVDALRKQYTGADGKVHPIVETLIAQQQQLAALMPQVKSAQEFAARQQQESLVRMIDSVFAAPENTSVHAVLGKDRASLTADQAAERQKVVQAADALYDGYSRRGAPITQAEALQRAIDMHASQNARASARAEITEEMKKRAAGTTLKPTHSVTPEKTKANSELDLREKTRARMKEAGLLA